MHMYNKILSHKYLIHINDRVAWTWVSLESPPRTLFSPSSALHREGLNSYLPEE